MKNKLLCVRNYKLLKSGDLVEVKFFKPEFDNGDWRCWYSIDAPGKFEKDTHSLIAADIVEVICMVSKVVDIKIEMMALECGEKVNLVKSEGLIID
jgi:hypothetical protein